MKKVKLTKQETASQVNFVLHGMVKNLEKQQEKLAGQFRKTSLSVEKASKALKGVILELKKER